MFKTIVVLFVSLAALAAQAQGSEKSDRSRGIIREPSRLSCSLSNSYFRVSDGIQKWEKYVSMSADAEVQVSCGREVAAAIAGSYLIVFSKGNFVEKYVSSSAGQTRELLVQQNMVAAVMGSYVLVAKVNNAEINVISKYVSVASDTPAKILIGNGLAAFAMGSYFLVGDGESIKEKYISVSGEAILHAKLASADDSVAIVVGSYFVVYQNGEFFKKYFGTADLNDRIAGGAGLIAASTNNYLIVFDSSRKSFIEKYIGSPGRIRVQDGLVLHEDHNNRLTIYSSVTGSFE